jgi:predicted CoA-binding protein
MMRILEVCFSHSLGGLELYMSDISQHLSQKGYEVWTIVPEHSELHKKIQGKGLRCYPMSPTYSYLDIVCAIKISKLIQKHKIDIIHVHKSTDLSILILAK